MNNLVKALRVQAEACHDLAIVAAEQHEQSDDPVAARRIREAAQMFEGARHELSLIRPVERSEKT